MKEFKSFYKTVAGKAVVEFLRVNSWVKKWFNINYEDWTHKEGGYLHLPLEKKINAMTYLKNRFESITVCEDVTEDYEYWKNNFNPNKDDCCNLRK